MKIFYKEVLVEQLRKITIPFAEFKSLIIMKIFNKEVLVELRKITTIDLACKSANLLEILLWSLIGITGTIWAVYFITLQVCW